MGLRSIMSCLERFPMVFSISLKNILTTCVFIAIWILLSTRSTLGCVRLQTNALIGVAEGLLAKQTQTNQRQ